MVHERRLKLDMSFEEALRRLARADEKELPARVKLKRKKTGGRSPPAKRKSKTSGE